ncbi:hypothetical protein [Coleofasciculus sp.]|uniref:hypothetical protein n=1 Tax=Coleofasciculus sp. TaxID=3100458 RepID=UPI003A316C4B
MYSIKSGRPLLARRGENCGIDIIIESGARGVRPYVEQVVGWVSTSLNPTKLKDRIPYEWRLYSIQNNKYNGNIHN